MTYIIGASGQAKETAIYVLDCGIDSEVVFVDIEKNKDFIAIRNFECPVIPESDFLSKIRHAFPKPDVVIAIGEPTVRARIVEKYIGFCDFPNVIHPSAEFLGKVKLGRGNIIAPMAFISVDCGFGDFNLINYGATIGHDCLLGSYNSIYPQSIISGNVQIGDCNLLGAGCAIMENVSIGNNNIIGMSGVCLNSIGHYGKYVGVPLKKIENIPYLL